MYCIYCGVQNTDGANFCSNCGKEMISRPTEEVVESRTDEPQEEIRVQEEPQHQSQAQQEVQPQPQPQPQEYVQPQQRIQEETAYKGKPLNIQVRVSGLGGWIPMLQGESQGRALERVLPELNANGYKVAFIVPDSPSFLWKLLNALIAVVTLGFYWRNAGVLIIGERID